MLSLHNQKKAQHPMEEQHESINDELIEALHISRPVYEEVQHIVGHMPTIDELSTLLAMWEGSGRQQGLLAWLKGQHHAVETNDYIYDGDGSQHREIREPRIKDCLDIARKLWGKRNATPEPDAPAAAPNAPSFTHSGHSLYLVGNISTEFLDSEYARQYLHLVDEPISLGNDDDDRDYHLMILSALQENGTTIATCEVEQGGIFGSLLRCSLPHRLGFDILSCREIRIDAFLFGEEKGRFIACMKEEDEEFFLQKLSEAAINCCFLGHTTKGRILVDGMDFGPSTDYQI